MLRASLPKNIEVVQEIDEGIDAIMANATQMHQVIMNLCANAEYAMRNTGGRLVVKLSPVEIVTDAFATQSNLQPGPYVRLIISDTGQGMTSAVKKRIFEPFFTTKGIGEGTGMGLAVVHGIIMHHGGTIEVESQPGQGSRFTIYLPQTDSDATEQVLTETSLNQDEGRRPVFIVD